MYISKKRCVWADTGLNTEASGWGWMGMGLRKMERNGDLSAMAFYISKMVGEWDGRWGYKYTIASSHLYVVLITPTYHTLH